jgi:hypothetical protein
MPTRQGRSRRIGLTATQEGRSLPHRAVVLAVSLTAAGLLAVPARGDDTKTVTFKETDKGSTFRFINNPPRTRRPGAGDTLVFSEPLVDASGARRGTLRATCTITGASAKRTPAICYGVFSLKEGQLAAVVSTANLDAKTTEGVIVGGTRAYANARGTFSSTSTKSGSNDTITLG